MEYKKQKEAYLKQLTTEQKQAIKSTRSEMRKNHKQSLQKKVKKSEEISLGKPKRPLSAYLLFSASKSKNTNMNGAALKSQWDQLAEDQKLAYKQKAQQLLDGYE